MMLQRKLAIGVGYFFVRGGASDEEIAEAITGSVWKKEEGHLINRPGFVRPERTMSQIGG